MTILTDYYGEVEYEEEDLIFFPDGLFGFPELKAYLPLCITEEDDSMILLQSTEQKEISFVVIDPFLLCPDYSPSLTPEELACLEVSDSKNLAYCAICVLKDNYLDSTINLKCPLVINPQTHKGIQVILEGSTYSFRRKFSSFSGIANPKNPDNRSDANADSQT